MQQLYYLECKISLASVAREILHSLMNMIRQKQRKNCIELPLLLALIFLGNASSQSVWADTGDACLMTGIVETFDGYVLNDTAMRIDDDERGAFTKIYTRLQLEYADWLTDRAQVSAALRAVYDAVYDVEEDFLPDNKDDYHAYVDLREAVMNLAFDAVDVSVGKQAVVWGKTDGLRVLDVVNPLDSRDIASTEFLDQRIPLWMGTVEYYLSSDFSLQGLVIPDMQFSKFSDPEFPEDALVKTASEPDISVENSRYGLRFSGFAGGWDFTLNYLYSWDFIPVFKTTVAEETGSMTVSPEYERLHILGGSWANVFWNTVVRGEIAVSFDKYFSVDDVSVPDMVTQKNLLDYALAFERDSFDIHWIGQVLQSTILAYDDTITTDDIQTYVTVQGSKDFVNDTVELSAFLMYNINEERLILRPSVSWDVTDAFAVTFGANLNEEGDGREDRVHVEMKYSF